MKPADIATIALVIAIAAGIALGGHWLDAAVQQEERP